MSLARLDVHVRCEIELAFQIVGPDGRPVTEFDVAHEKELHLIVVSRDLVEYLHVHPERADDGTWSITLPARGRPVRTGCSPTSLRPAASSLTLGADIAVAGEFAPADTARRQRVRPTSTATRSRSTARWWPGPARRSR